MGLLQPPKKLVVLTLLVVIITTTYFYIRLYSSFPAILVKYVHEQELGSCFILKRDPIRLAAYIRDRVLVPPKADVPYNLSSYKTGEDPSQLGQTRIVLHLLKNQTGGFFLESGANNGEELSNTLVLEKEFGWTGLLIEPDPRAFQQLIWKNRKAWMANICLSLNDYAEVKTFYLDKLSVLSSLKITGQQTELVEVNATCIPLPDVLSVLNITVIDYWSLDVEGNEMEILKTVPFDKILFKIITVEHNHFDGGAQLVNHFLKKKGFNMLQVLKFDAVFVHNSIDISYLANHTFDYGQRMD